MNRLTRIFVAFGLSLVLTTGSAKADGVTYGYDPLGRLITVTYLTSGGSTVITYTYDVAGNRTSKVIQCTGTTC